MSKLDTLFFLTSWWLFHIPKTYRLSWAEDVNEFHQLDICRPMIMRSSFSIEDGEKYAFAWMFNSHFPIFTKQDFLRWLELCSEVPERAILYAKSIGFDREITTPDIFLQEFIVGDFSGVIFTTYGIWSTRIEIAPWILAPLVQGEISFPMILECDKNHIENMKIVQTYLHTSYQTIENTIIVKKPFSWIGFERRVKNMLFDIMDLVRKMESLFGAPQDIEFTVRDGIIYVLQSRPISA